MTQPVNQPGIGMNALPSVSIYNGITSGKISFQQDPFSMPKLSVCATFETSDLPAIEFDALDENGATVKLTMLPETDVTPFELSKLLRLSIAHIQNPLQVNALAFVKKHGLERHFTYA